MNLLELRYFMIVAKHEHITKAAEELNVSQPSVSHTISKLEKELGVVLFDRRGRNIILNDNGRRILRRVQNIFYELEQIEQEAALLDPSIYQKISLATTNNIFISTLLSQYLLEHGGLKIEQRILNKKSILKNITSGQIIFGIMPSYIPAPEKEFEAKLLHHDRYVLVVKKNHPFAKNGCASLAEIAKEPLLCLPKDFGEPRIVDIVFKGMDIKPNIIFEGHIEVLGKMFSAEKGVILSAASPKYHAEEVRQQMDKVDFVLVDIEDYDGRFSLYLYWLKSRNLTRIEEDFKNYVISFYS